MLFDRNQYFPERLDFSVMYLNSSHHSDGSSDVRMNADFSQNAKRSDFTFEIVRVKKVRQYLKLGLHIGYLSA
jgi:hypothetical protein